MRDADEVIAVFLSCMRDILFPCSDVEGNLLVELPGGDVPHDLKLPLSEVGLHGRS